MTVLETRPEISSAVQNHLPSPRPRAGTWLWITTAVAAAALLAQAVLSPLSQRDPALSGLFTAAALTWQILALVFVFWHGGRRYGAWGIITLFVVTEVISNGYENLSIATGFPFGHYNYPHDGTPFIFQVPATIGLAYFGYGYAAWCVASVLLGRGDASIRGWFGTFVQPAAAAFVMVMWDLVMDPLNSTIGHTWIWHDGGGYNGVPLTNYLGWYLTVWTVYQVFTLILHFRQGLMRPQPARGFWAMPVIIYGVTAVSYIAVYLFAQHSTVVDATGRSWTTAGISETSVTVMLFTMLFATFLAAVRLGREAVNEKSPATQLL